MARPATQIFAAQDRILDGAGQIAIVAGASLFVASMCEDRIASALHTSALDAAKLRRAPGGTRAGQPSRFRGHGALSG